jgi:hypothetical protein
MDHALVKCKTVTRGVIFGKPFVGHFRNLIDAAVLSVGKIGFSEALALHVFGMP